MNSSDLPIFNYLPLEKLHAFVSKVDNDEARKLLDGLQGEEGCCWGNPCYYRGCLACFCRGNIKFLTSSQAYTQAGFKIKSDKGGCALAGEGTRKPVIRDGALTKEMMSPYRKHLSDYFFEKLP